MGKYAVPVCRLITNQRLENDVVLTRAMKWRDAPDARLAKAWGLEEKRTAQPKASR